MSGPTMGLDLFGDPVEAPRPAGLVSDRFLFPPFSLLDARKGEWQERKRTWIGMGIESEVGRDASLTYNIPLKSYDGDRMEEEYYSEDAQKKNTSVFDPVLCELFYRWFAPRGGLVLDPFAGGSVRGVVSSALGRRYLGIELREEQVRANYAQSEAMGLDPRPEWLVGDALDLALRVPKVDSIFTCPPYGDLEVYSDDPRDLSRMSAGDFLRAYRKIIALSVRRLRVDRFAGIVVGDYRDAEGFFVDFVGTTVNAFREAGAGLYNRAVISTMVGSGSMRASRQFTAGRKLVKTHQTLLVFAKGDPMAAARFVEESESEAEPSTNGTGPALAVQQDLLDP